MPDLFLNVLCACGTISSAALTLALVKAVYDYVRSPLTATPAVTDDSGVKHVSPAVAFEPPPLPHVLLDSGQQKKQPVTLSTILEQALRVHATGIEATFPPPAVPVTPRAADEFDLECGNCHNQIKSSPINVDSKGQGKSERRYRCESCGAIVAVKS